MVIGLILGLVLGSASGVAQPAKNVATVVVLGDDIAMGPLPSEWREALRAGLKDLGWVEHRNLRLELRSAKTRELRSQVAAEVVKLNPDVIVAAAPAAFAYGSLAPEVAARQHFTSPITTIPIVFAGVSDPVGAGMVKSLARPGSMMTGIAYLGIELNPKRLQLLKEALPAVTRVGALVPSNHPMRDVIVREIEATAAPLAVKLQLFEINLVDTADKIDQAFATMARDRVQAVLGLQGPQFFRERNRIADLSLAHRLPGIFELAEYADAGCLMTYAPNAPDIWRYAATFVDRILKGANPADLPVERPRKLDLVVNLRTAKALKVAIPSAVLARADRVIE
jgi:putative ABC transport system substrate-binding protein